MYSQGSSSQIKSISQPLPLLTVWKGSIGICSSEQLTIYHLNYLSVTFETNIILLHSTCQNYCSWYCNPFDNKIGSNVLWVFPSKGRAGKSVFFPYSSSKENRLENHTVRFRLKMVRKYTCSILKKKKLRQSIVFWTTYDFFFFFFWYSSNHITKNLTSNL
jgi:hypothetical protein